MHFRSLSAALLALLAVVLLAPASALRAQALPSELQGLTRQQIVERIEASGLTEAQLRDQLRRAGYDPALADRYFGDEAGEGARTAGPEDLEFVEALATIGVSLAPDSPDADSVGFRPDSLLFYPDSMSEASDTAGLEVFGRDVFRRAARGFEPSATGSVGPSYLLGPGDEVLLILTGDVELAYRLDVTREGYIFVPDVGQVYVNGLTVSQLEDRLYERLGRVYSGIRRSGDATTRFTVSIGRLRTNQVYVVGEVERPGSYRLSAAATPLEALYMAGGPRTSGSFRNVVVRRGDELIGVFDLYHFLTAGERPVGMRLTEGDVVFVPPVGPQVAVTGEVVRPARYEVLLDESLADVLDYAGGLTAAARIDAVRIERILPPGERERGRDRVVVTADLREIDPEANPFPVRGGDSISVAPLLDEVRGWVEIRGGVYQPGRYEHEPGATVSSLVEKAGGTLPDVFAPVVHLSSLDRTDGSRSLLKLPLDRAGQVTLDEFDIVRLFSVDSLLTPDSVAVFGLVGEPGRYPLEEGATADDLILLAGGLAYGSDPRRAEVARLPEGGEGTLEEREMFEVGLPEGLPYPGPANPDSLPSRDSGMIPASSLPLRPGDEVYVRQLPGFSPSRRVAVTGEVRYPGTYVLRSEEDRVSDLLRRAGGVTEEAYLPGFRLIRDGLTVGVELGDALDEPGSPADPTLRAGDRMTVPSFDPTIVVQGAVAFDSRVLYEEGMDLDDVIALAGGLTPRADKGRITVEYANGSRAIVTRKLGINFSEPDIEPGSRVIVPSVPESEVGFDWDSALTRVLTVASTLATVIIATR